MDRYSWCIAGTWNDHSTSYNVNLGQLAMKERLLRLWSVDVLAVGLALLALGYTCCVHHRAQERLNEIESVVNEGIHIPAQPTPPVRFEPECQ